MRPDWSHPDDRQLARSIFGSDDNEAVCRAIRDWAAEQGFAGSEVTAITLSIGAGVTLALPDDARLFVKIWPGTADAALLRAQMRVQQALADRGFPAPRVLAELVVFGTAWASVMDYASPGMPPDPSRPAVRTAMATGLARLSDWAGRIGPIEGLRPRLLPPEGAIWPPPHNVLFDFEATRAGAEWIDAIAAAALDRLRAAQSPFVVGHCDWSAQNMRMRGDAIAIVYDWDSVFLERETIILGSAAANFPIGSARETPAVEQVATFVRDYEGGRAAPFTPAERDEIAAAATYARAYKARCEHAIGAGWSGSSREDLLAHGPFRF